MALHLPASKKPLRLGLIPQEAAARQVAPVEEDREQRPRRQCDGDDAHREREGVPGQFEQAGEVAETAPGGGRRGEFHERQC